MSSRGFRLNEVGRQFEGRVFASVFVEHKDVFGLTVRATAGNLFDARSRLDRTVFAGRRNAAPIVFVETRERLIGPVFSFSVSGMFQLKHRPYRTCSQLSRIASSR